MTLYKRILVFIISLCAVFTEGHSNIKIPDVNYMNCLESHFLKDTVLHRKRIYNTRHIDVPPVIDGKLNDSCWRQGEWQGDYEQMSPVYRGKAHYRTDLKILYDDKNIYVAIRAWDDMKLISRRLGRRDNFSGDLVGVHFDSYFDHRTAFEFDMTAAGQKIDVWVSNDGWDTNWNSVWDGKVAYEDSAWTAEYKIPLSQLRYGSSPDQVWGLDSWRFVDRTQEENQWNLVANDGTGLVYTFGELHGLKGLKKASRIELAPYLSGKITTQKKESGNPFTNKPTFNFLGGVDAKIGITNNFTLDATINPDFGQVEADPSVMNLSAFETYFEEKRPFFLEGKNIFDFTFDKDFLFYTRRIGHAPSYSPAYDTVSIPEYTTIGGAFKLSGKTAKGFSMGIIESVALKEVADIHNNNNNFQQDAEPLTNYLIGRFQKDFLNGNTILGGIITHTHRLIRNDYLNFLSRDALTYGLDFTKYWKDRKYFFEVKAIGSNINGDKNAIQRLQTSSARFLQRPDLTGLSYDTSRTALDGYGASFRIGKWSKGHWRYNEEYIMRSAGLELNDLGFMTLSNIQKNNFNISYVEKNNHGIFKTYDFALLQQNAWDMHGDGLYSLISLTAESEFMNSWKAMVISQYKFRTKDEWLLRGGPAMKVPDLFSLSWLLSTNSAKTLVFNLTGSYNHGQAGNLNLFSLQPQIDYHPRSNLVFSIQPNYLINQDELQYISPVVNSSNNKSWLLGKVDNRNLGITFRVDLALTPEFMIQYYGSPFVSIGKYSNFKEIIKPLDSDYNNRFISLTPQKNDQLYRFDDNNDGIMDYTIGNPDFNYRQFRSNLVLRWEYKVGSTFYFVWSQDRTSFELPGTFSFNSNFRELSGMFPKNIFMIKFNYWFSR